MALALIAYSSALAGNGAAPDDDLDHALTVVSVLNVAFALFVLGALLFADRVDRFFARRRAKQLL